MPQIDLGQVVGPRGVQGEPGPQGAQGIQGPAGPAATINGVNALIIEAGNNIELSQSGSTTRLSVPTDAAPTEDSTKPVQSGGVAAALSNKAPAGFGLGTVAVNISDLNDATKNGWYMNGAGGEAVHAPDNVPGWLVLVCAYADEIVFQTAYRYGSDEGLISARRSYHYLFGGWHPWEWINPPMQLGVEYRTAGRYNGKPVYTKLVDCGAGPSNTRKTVSANTQNVETPISCTGNFGSGTIPYEWFAGDVSGAQAITCTFNGQAIEIAATADYSGWTVSVIVEYTKTTD